MALTNYLMQTVVCLALFYGVGLGLGPDGGYAVRLVVWALVFAAQLAFSHWWLRRYHLGPMEWLWRSATYGRMQPQRRRPDAAVRAGACSDPGRRPSPAR